MCRGDTPAECLDAGSMACALATAGGGAMYALATSRASATKATLEVLTHNAGAERLYRDLGFEFGTSAMHAFITRALGWILTACHRIATSLSLPRQG